MAVRDPLVSHLLGHPLSEVAPARDAEAILGHHFARPELLREALTHRSAVEHDRTHGPRGPVTSSNERLEFVGDRVLGLLIAEWLAERFPSEQEGELGRRLAHLVSQPVLAAIAEEIGLQRVLSIAPNEARAGVRTLATVLADATEAAIGAIFLDDGLDAARVFVRRVWADAMITQAAPPKDAKTALQEWAQQRGFPLPTYAQVTRDGPPHSPVFTISVDVDGTVGQGTAGSKRAAEQRAAASLLAVLRTRGPGR